MVFSVTVSLSSKGKFCVPGLAGQEVEVSRFCDGQNM